MINKVILIGNLGRDPETRYTQAGDAVTSFSIACTEKFGDKEHTEWVNIVTWKKLAEICSQYLTKGQTVYIEGRLQTRSWETDGKKQHKTEVIANTVKFLSKKGDKQQSDTSTAAPEEQPEEVTETEPF